MIIPSLVARQFNNFAAFSSMTPAPPSLGVDLSTKFANTSSSPPHQERPGPGNHFYFGPNLSRPQEWLGQATGGSVADYEKF